jgi:hypothetical protein
MSEYWTTDIAKQGKVFEHNDIEIEQITMTEELKMTGSRGAVFDDCWVKATITIGGMIALAKNELDTLEDVVEGTKWERQFRPYIKQAGKAYQMYYDAMRRELSVRKNFYFWSDYMNNMVGDCEINMTYLRVALSNRLNKLHVPDVEIKTQVFITYLMINEAVQYHIGFFETYKRNGYDFGKYFAFMKMNRMRAAMETVLKMCCREEVNLDIDEPFVNAYNALFNKFGSATFLNSNGFDALRKNKAAFGDNLAEPETVLLEGLGIGRIEKPRGAKGGSQVKKKKQAEQLTAAEIKDLSRQKYKRK